MTTNRDFYERTYHFDDDVIRAGFPRLRRALRLLEPLPGTRFLDLGSGVGWAAHLAATENNVSSAVAVDVALRALQVGTEFVPGPLRVQGDGTRLPFPSGSFDRVLSFGSIEHFPDVLQGLMELARVLDKDGQAVVVVPNVYVRTEQPSELTLTYFGWRKLISAAQLKVTATGADRGPVIFRDRRFGRILLRAGGRGLSFIPGLQYQFMFLVRHKSTTT